MANEGVTRRDADDFFKDVMMLLREYMYMYPNPLLLAKGQTLLKRLEELNKKEAEKDDNSTVSEPN